MNFVVELWGSNPTSHNDDHWTDLPIAATTPKEAREFLADLDYNDIPIAVRDGSNFARVAQVDAEGNAEGYLGIKQLVSDRQIAINERRLIEEMNSLQRSELEVMGQWF